MERELSDDDDDRENLITQNDTRHHHTLHVADDNNNNNNNNTSTSPRRRFSISSLTKKNHIFCVLVLLIPLLLFLLLLSLSSSPPSSTNNPLSSSDAIRNSELRALNLLSQQRHALLSLLNANNHYSNSTNATASDFQSAIFDQILLNRQIQDALLSPHRSGSFLNFSSSNYSDNDALLLPKNQCGRLDRRFSDRRTIKWDPRSDKFLFAICLSGQMSNHLICLEKHMFFAALLGRVLVIPSPRFDFEYSNVLDIDRINKCLGKDVVIKFDEFVEKMKKHVRIDRFVCYFSSPALCYVDDDHVKKLKELEISVGKLESPWDEDIKHPKKRTVADIQTKFAADDDVIAIGDVFFADVEGDWFMQPGGPIAHNCKTLVEPSRLIMVTAQRFIQTFLGETFVALHFRRHGFLKFCNAKNPSCFYPIPQAADCIARMVERANAPVIYLSTDAAESETGLLQSLIVVDGKTIPLVKRPPPNSAEKWDSLLYRNHIEGDSQVEAMLDKTICAMSSVFIGAPGSTFTEDILRLRKDWGTSSMCDEYLCHGELPNFIAENE